MTGKPGSHSHLPKPLIFDIARASFSDGPGLRTVVFVKGCPLNCLWCQNPESQLLEPETFFYPENCIRCGQCKINGDAACSSLARRVAGRYYPPPELATLIVRDRVFYRTSSGGVTFSGGEPFLFIDYIYDVARLLKQENLHVAVETCGYFDFNKLKKALLPLIDLFLFDIKVMDPDKHLEYTGKSNDLIIRNFVKLQQSGANIVPRIPLIPGYTAVEENLSQIADFFDSQRIETWSFLPYNPSGLEKLERLGKTIPENVSAKSMTRKEEKQWIAFFNQRRKSQSLE